MLEPYSYKSEDQVNAERSRNRFAIAAVAGIGGAAVLMATFSPLGVATGALVVAAKAFAAIGLKGYAATNTALFMTVVGSVVGAGSAGFAMAAQSIVNKEKKANKNFHSQYLAPDVNGDEPKKKKFNPFHIDKIFAGAPKLPAFTPAHAGMAAPVLAHV